MRQVVPIASVLSCEAYILFYTKLEAVDPEVVALDPKVVALDPEVVALDPEVLDLVDLNPEVVVLVDMDLEATDQGIDIQNVLAEEGTSQAKESPKNKSQEKFILKGGTSRKQNKHGFYLLARK
jgi:hypothetical protein